MTFTTFICTIIGDYLKPRQHCCLQEGDTDPRCASIKVPKDDPYLKNTDIQCLNFSRVETFQDAGCVPKTRYPEQVGISLSNTLNCIQTCWFLSLHIKVIELENSVQFDDDHHTLAIWNGKSFLADLDFFTVRMPGPSFSREANSEQILGLIMRMYV